MKTTAISKIAKVTCLVTITLPATFQIQSARAIPVMYTLTLTEVSSTVLTYTYNNPLNPTPFTITPINPDAWNVTIDPQSNITLFSGFTFDFAEGMAEPANQVNRIQGGSSSPWF